MGCRPPWRVRWRHHHVRGLNNCCCSFLHVTQDILVQEYLLVQKPQRPALALSMTTRLSTDTRLMYQKSKMSISYITVVVVEKSVCFENIICWWVRRKNNQNIFTFFSSNSWKSPPLGKLQNLKQLGIPRVNCHHFGREKTPFTIPSIRTTQTLLRPFQNNNLFLITLLKKEFNELYVFFFLKKERALKR